MAVVKLVPSRDTEAIISVFKVGVSTFSSNTTILLEVATLVDVNGSEIIVVEAVDYDTPQPVIST